MGPFDPGLNPEEVLLAKENLLECINALKVTSVTSIPSEQLVGVFFRRFGEGMTRGEIAEDMGLSKAQVDLRQAKVSKELRRLLRGRRSPRSPRYRHIPEPPTREELRLQEFLRVKEMEDERRVYLGTRRYDAEKAVDEHLAQAEELLGREWALEMQKRLKRLRRL